MIQLTDGQKKQADDIAGQAIDRLWDYVSDSVKDDIELPEDEDKREELMDELYEEVKRAIIKQF